MAGSFAQLALKNKKYKNWENADNYSFGLISFDF